LIADDAATFDEALALCRSGRLGDARRILEDYTARRPSALPAQLLLARILHGILARDPQGVIVLIRTPYYNYAQLLQQRLARTLADVWDRVIFLDAMRYSRFLQLLSLADVCLDTVHFNGMNTSLEAFSVGTPIVTLPGRLQRGRHTQAMYRKMEILECIAKDAEDYVEIAVRLGCNQDFARAIKQRIAARSGILFEDLRVVTEFERFFLSALREARPEVAWPPATHP
jgi:predicted O-linked N-acetylglucosamine transferase (SPINDLY family)